MSGDIQYVKTDIPKAGSPRVNCAFLAGSYGLKKEKKPLSVAIGVDMKDKRCEVTGHVSDPDRGPGICIEIGEEEQGKSKGIFKPTIVYFPEYKDYTVWCADVSKYTVAVCLIRKKKDEE